MPSGPLSTRNGFKPLFGRRVMHTTGSTQTTSSKAVPSLCLYGARLVLPKYWTRARATGARDVNRCPATHHGPQLPAQSLVLCSPAQQLCSEQVSFCGRVCQRKAFPVHRHHCQSVQDQSFSIRLQVSHLACMTCAYIPTTLDL